MMIPLLLFSNLMHKQSIVCKPLIFKFASALVGGKLVENNFESTPVLENNIYSIILLSLPSVIPQRCVSLPKKSLQVVPPACALRS